MRLGHLHAEQHALDRGNEVPALQLLRRAKGFGGKLLSRPLSVAPQHVAAPADCLPRNVLKLPVEFVPAGPHGAGRLGQEKVFDELSPEFFPPGFGHGNLFLPRRLSADPRDRSGRCRPGRLSGRRVCAQVHWK